ncbi:uncharacterized protein LOC141659597 [Apium graveolens]|uniref:uncharacterized protein LOC141659597 n=1 Tax=Apium graveolens TaxID=4045 RepID=UPI003D796E78
MDCWSKVYLSITCLDKNQDEMVPVQLVFLSPVFLLLLMRSCFPGLVMKFYPVIVQRCPCLTQLFKVVILFGKAFELFKLEGGESGYAANKSMQNSAFCNADGDFLLVPQQGKLWITWKIASLSR